MASDQIGPVTVHQVMLNPRWFALVIATVVVAACGQAEDEPPVETAQCGPELEKLREEMQWADATIAQPRPRELAGVSEWTHSTVPERYVEVSYGEIGIDGKIVATLPDLAADIESDIAAWPESDPIEIAHDADRSLDRRLAHELKPVLASFGQIPVALAIDPTEPWQGLRPTIRALSKEVGTVRLLVGMPPPAWWDERLFEELWEGADGLGMFAHRVSLRAVEVFARCPGAITRSAELPGNMIAWVDGIEACSCRADMNASRALLHALGTPMIAPVGTVDLTVATSGDGAPFEADPKAPWSEVLPRLLAAPAPILLPDPPESKYVPPPPPPRAE